MRTWKTDAQGVLKMTDKSKLAFEHWWNTPNEESHLMNGLMKAQAQYVWMESEKSHDAEIEQIQKQLDQAKEMAEGIDSCIGNPRTSYQDVTLYAEKQIKDFLLSIKEQV